MTNCPNCDDSHTLNLNGYAWCRHCGALITLTSSGHVRRFLPPNAGVVAIQANRQQPDGAVMEGVLRKEPA